MKIVRLLSNLGYGSRRQVIALGRDGRVTDSDGEGRVAGAWLDPGRIRCDGVPLPVRAPFTTPGPSDRDCLRAILLKLDETGHSPQIRA